jgi:hypothetical protein
MEVPSTTGAQQAWRPIRFPLTKGARVRAALLLGLIVSGVVVIALRDPRAYGMGVLCPTRRLLGLYCPGCGTTRAAHDLLGGQPASAIANNPLAVFAGLPLLACLLVNLTFGAFWGFAWRISLPSRVGAVAVTVLVLYTIARNIPAERLDFLRPPPYRLLPEATSPANAGSE